jgi:AcrR family transcriptional regulator
VTRQLILDAAESLFTAKGYAGSTVSDIAALADVAVTTVYGNVGNKAEIVVALIRRGAEDPIVAETASRVGHSSDPRTAVDLLAAGVCESIQKLLPVVAVMYDAASAERSIAEAVALTEASYRQNLAPLVTHLREHGWLNAELSDHDALDILWFYFGIPALRTLHAAGWDWDRIERWLSVQASQALLD